MFILSDTNHPNFFLLNLVCMVALHSTLTAVLCLLSSQQDKSAQRQARDERVEKLREKMRGVEQSCADSKAQMNEALRSLTSLRENKHELA